MIYFNPRIRTFARLSLLISFFVFGSSLRAQTRVESGGSAAIQVVGAPSFLKSSPTGELFALYTPHTRDEIKRRLDFEKASQQSAQDDVTENGRILTSSDGQRQIMDAELKAMKIRVSVAKKDKNQKDRAGLEMELKRQQNEKNYFDLLQSSVKADAVWLKSESSAADARVKALELENDLAESYENLAKSVQVKPEEIMNYRALLMRTLNGQQDAANRSVDAASKQKEVAARRLKQLAALSKLQP